MGGMTEFYTILSIAWAVSGIATPIVIWRLCAIMRKGLNEHIGMMQLIYEASHKVANNPTGQIAVRPQSDAP
jgi:hypothetical protein